MPDQMFSGIWYVLGDFGQEIERIEDLEIAGRTGLQLLVPRFREAAHGIMLGLVQSLRNGSVASLGSGRNVPSGRNTPSVSVIAAGSDVKFQSQEVCCLEKCEEEDQPIYHSWRLENWH